MKLHIDYEDLYLPLEIYKYITENGITYKGGNSKIEQHSYISWL